MTSDERRDTSTYRVVINDEGQYSIWLAERDLPPGWKEDSKGGTKTACLAYINEVWNDMRPRSLCKRVEEEKAAVKVVSVLKESGDEHSDHQSNN